MSPTDHDKYLREMRKRIRNAYREQGKGGSSKRSPGEDLRREILRHRRTLKVLPPDIELWLTFFDEALSFWFVVWATYRFRIEGSTDKRSICLMALAGRVFQDMCAVRELIVQGFFVQSNVVTRSLVEAIDVMHLINSRPELATEFAGIEENSESSKFWHKYCSRDKISRIVRERWLWFFDGNEDAANAFHSMRGGYLDLMGMSAHPSFGASFVTFMDSTRDGPDNIARIAMGAISHMSKFTIHLILNRVFEYGFLWSGPEMSIYKGGVVSEPKSPLHESVSKGLSVMLGIVKATGEAVEGDPFYPKFETYWPRGSFSDPGGS